MRINVCRNKFLKVKCRAKFFWFFPDREAKTFLMKSTGPQTLILKILFNLEGSEES